MADEHAEFRALLERVGEGDKEAAAEFLEKYRSLIDTIVRRYARRLHPKLRHLCEPDDIFQSFLCHFLNELSQKKLEVTTPEQLIRVIAVKVKHRVAKYNEQHLAACRDVRRLHAVRIEELPVTAPESAPEKRAANAECLSTIRHYLSDSERRLLDRRYRLAHSWNDVAKELGISVVAARQQHRRIITRLAELLTAGSDRPANPA